MLFDPLYLVVTVAALAICGLASLGVKLAFGKYSRIPNRRGITGAQAAAEMLRREGVEGVRIERVGGWLSDHYSPSEHVVRLSPDVHDGRSIAAISVACHECGHALQHAHGYAPLALRSLAVPLAGIGGNLGPVLCVIGIALGAAQQAASGGGLGLMLAKAGIVLFAAAALFQIITLPVEFNASARAKRAMVADGIVVNDEEAAGAASMLRAAAMTYVAAVVSTILWLLYYAFRAGLLGGRRDNE